MTVEDDLHGCRMSVLNFYNFDFGSASESAPPGAKSPDQTWNFEFENNVLNDVGSFRDAKHHYLKFLLIGFSCTVWIHKKKFCHKTSSTVLGLASALNLVVVTKRFRWLFWIYWALVFRKKLDHGCTPSNSNISYEEGGWGGKRWKNNSLYQSAVDWKYQKVCD